MLKRIHCWACVLNLFEINTDTCAGIFVRHRVNNPQATYVWKYMRLKDNTFSGTELNFCLNTFKDRKSKGKKFRSLRFGGLFACFVVLVYMCMYMYMPVCVPTYVHVCVQMWMWVHMCAFFVCVFVCVYGSQRSASDVCLPLLIFLYLISFIFVCFVRYLSPCSELTIKDYTDQPVCWKDLLESASQCWAAGTHLYGRL